MHPGYPTPNSKHRPLSCTSDSQYSSNPGDWVQAGFWKTVPARLLVVYIDFYLHHLFNSAHMFSVRRKENHLFSSAYTFSIRRKENQVPRLRRDPKTEEEGGQ